jgi:hypothetical protein
MFSHFGLLKIAFQKKKEKLRNFMFLRGFSWSLEVYMS